MEEVKIMQVPFNRLDLQFEKYQREYEEKVLSVLRSGWYILGKEVSGFETELASYLGSKYAVGVASGLDALVLAFRALGIGKGDEVIVAANAYIACFMGISMNGATPVPVEPDEYYNLDVEKIESALTSKTKAILAVHLYGQTCDMVRLSAICKEKGLFLVEDCAQSQGSLCGDRKSGTFGDIACFSFYPSKNLGAFGDAGAVVTDREDLAERVRVLRNYGSEKRYHNEVIGYNSRLDEIQAGLLRIRLTHLEELNREREKIALRYLRGIRHPKMVLPTLRDGCSSVWHLFVVRVEERQRWIDYLGEKGIGTVIHYPIPPHLSQAYRDLGYEKGTFPYTEKLADEVLSLPLYHGMTEEETDYVIESINRF